MGQTYEDDEAAHGGSRGTKEGANQAEDAPPGDEEINDRTIPPPDAGRSMVGPTNGVFTFHGASFGDGTLVYDLQWWQALLQWCTLVEFCRVGQRAPADRH